jgi:hypothetical protein
MNMSKSNVKSLTVPEIAIIAATRGALGFGAGCYLQTSSDEQNGKRSAGRCSFQIWQARSRLRCTSSERRKRLSASRSIVL